jgi:long-chain fatty acid transport protein
MVLISVFIKGIIMIKKIIKLSILSMLFSFSQTIYASGFAIIEHSASGLGQSFAGASAVAEDASTVYFNPAGMTYLKGSQVTAGMHIIKPKTYFIDNGSQARLAGSVPVALGNNSGGDAGGYNFVPNFYYVRQFDNGLHFGLGINSPVGLKNEYNSRWLGRYTSIESDLKTVNINPSIAFKANKQLSVGLGVSVQYLKTSLVNKTFLCAHPQLAPSCNPTNSSHVLASDAETTMEGDGWAVGFNLGIIYQLTDSTRIGVAYRSQVTHHLDGDLDVKLANGSKLVHKPISADVDVPTVLSLSLLHQVSSKIVLLGDMTYTDWSSFEQLKVDFTDGSPSDITEEKWHNSMRYSLGLKYILSPVTILRAGIAQDNTAIDDPYRTSRIPGDNRTWMSLGMTYKMSKQLSMDIAYAYLWVKDAKINEKFDGLAGAMQGELNGKYNSSVNILSAQLNWIF